MRDYIKQRLNESYKDFNFKGVDVVFDEDLPSDINIKTVLRAIEDRIPRVCYSDLEKIVIGDRQEFRDRGINAIYRDDTLFITNQQDDAPDLLDDIVHEIAHHVEEKFPEEIYGDGLVQREFVKKRKQLEFELRSEGYWTSDYDFTQIKFSDDLDKFLYNRVGQRMLKMTTSGIFVRPYASVSVREYFATGFEAYYLNTEDKDLLFNLSPELYKKIDLLNNKLK